MAVDLGAVVARVVLEDVEFRRTVMQDIQILRDFGAQAGRSAAGTAELDGSLAGVSASASKTGASLGRAAKASTDLSVAEQKAAVAAVRHAAAVSEVASAMTRSASAGERVQMQTLRQVAAQERLVAASGEAGSAEQLQARETARLASAQASAISATRALATAQAEGAVSSGRFAGALGGTLKMAGQLGLMFGAFEAVKKTIDIGREAGDFQQKMLLIQTNAGQSAAEVRNMSAAVLAMAGPLATAPDKLADALYHVEQNGAHGKDALDALRVGAEGAKIGMADVEDTTNTMTIAMASGIKGVGDLQQAMGFMIATVGTGDMRLRDLNEALSGGILSTAKGFGASLRDVAAVLATLGDNGIRGANAATAIRQTMMGFAAPAKGGADALRSVGLSLTDLRDAMEKHGLVYAMNDLEQHMKSAGVTGAKVGGFITQAFGKRAGAGVGVLMGEIDRLNTKYAEAEKGAQNFGERWAATTKTAKFQFAELGASAQAEGVKMATAALPLATIVAGQLGGALRDVIHLVGQVGSGFAPAFHLVGAAIGAAAFALHGITSALAAIAPVIKVVAVSAAALWVGMKAGQLVAAGIAAIGGAFETLQIKALYAQDAVAAGWARVGGAATIAAAETGAAAATIGAEAEGASATVVASGEAAEIGWAGLAGPLGAAALGVFAIVSLFHKSTSASKEATAAAKAYTDALTSDSASRSTIFDTIRDQLTKNNVPQQIAALNSALGRTAVTGSQFVTAIANGGPALTHLSNQLESVITKNYALYTSDVKAGQGNTAQAKGYKARADAAQQLLGVLGQQYQALSGAAQQDLLNTRAFAGAAGAIQKTTVATKLGTAAAQQYATMAGLVVDKNGIVAASQAQVNAAIAGVSNAYDTATASGSAYLSALDTFSKSAGTSADRAALIGSTLVAANGDALNFAGAMNASAVASHQFFTDVRSNAKSAKESIGGYLTSLINLRTGTINYNKAGAGPLISDLQGIQSAAMQAAQATYQHARATENGKKAADDAYKVYQSQTRGALMDEATQLGLTAGQAKRLADRYFGMPKKVKTLIEQEGASPVISVLNKIGTQLSFLTGHPWNPKVGVNDQASAPLQNIHDAVNNIPDSKTVTVTVNTVGSLGSTYNSQVPVQARAAGGPIVGAGTATSDSILIRGSNGEHMISAAEVRGLGGHGAVAAIRAAARSGYRVPGFATGGAITTGQSDGKKVWIYGGERYASLRAAQNAQHSAGTKQGKLVYEIKSKDIPKFIVSLSKTTAQLVAAERTLTHAAKQAGLGAKALGRIADAEKHLNALSRRRNRVARQLGTPTNTRQTAWQALEAARSAYQGERSTVAGNITGGFDLAQAGRSSGTGVTIDSILGDSRQQKANARLFNRQLDKLKSMGLGKTELQQLAEKGFAGAESSTLALLGGSRKQIRELNSNVAGLGVAAGKTGTFAADLLYGRDVKTAQKRVRSLEAQEARIDARMERIGDRIVQTIGKGLHIDVHIGGEKIQERVRHEVHHHNRATARAVQLQAGRPH